MNLLYHTLVKRFLSSVILLTLISMHASLPIKASGQEATSTPTVEVSEEQTPEPPDAVDDVSDAGEEIETEQQVEEVEPVAGLEEEELVEVEDLSTATTSISSVSTSTGATTTLNQAGQASTTAVSSSDTTVQSDDAISENTATGSPTIISGNAIAMANILNMVNTNFVNAEGAIVFKNYFNPVTGTIDLRPATSTCTASSSTPCMQGDGTTINSLNDAYIDNYILLSANSGNNEISTSGEATIDTGNAYAGLNLINLANNNFVDSNYLLVTLNAFQGVAGDIVFPSLSAFFDSLLNSAPAPNSLQITNNAAVQNNINTSADTGDNVVGGTASSTISTGNAYSTTNIFNQLNTTLAGVNNISILFRIHGDWVGEVFGAPEGLSWIQGDDGSIFMFNSTGSTTQSETSGGGITDVTATNNAVIKNDVTVVALTGNNRVGGASSALIQTGDAHASANIVNVANSNIIGKNWIMAVINIFGNFKGNIAFGRPDLWVGAQANLPRAIRNDSEIIYKLSILNNGDSPSTQTQLKETFDSEHLDIIESSLPYVREGDSLIWDLGSIPAQMGTEITYKARIKNDGGSTHITNTVSVSGRETDNNQDDNSDSLTVTTERRGSGRNWRQERLDREAELVLKNATTTVSNLVVTRNPFQSNVNPSEPNSLVSHQTLTIVNPTDKKVDKVLMRDILRDSEGKTISSEIWDFGTIRPHEEITVTYDLKFSTSAPAGLYEFSTDFKAQGSSHSFLTNGFVVVMTVVEPREIVGEVLGTTTPEPPQDGDFILDLDIPIAHAEGPSPQIPETGGSSIPRWLIITGFALMGIGLPFFRFPMI